MRVKSDPMLFSPFFCCVLRLCGCGDQTFCQRVCGTGHTRVQLLQLCSHSEEIWKHTVSQRLTLSLRLCHSLKARGDSEHSVSCQSWCKCITLHEQMSDQGSVCKLRWLWSFGLHLLHFPLLCLLPRWGNCLSFLFINQKKWKSISPFSPTPYFFIHFFHAKEFLINELSLCEVAEIHLVVSNLDFYTRSILMSLHIFIAFVCVGVFLLVWAHVWKIFTLPLVTVFPCVCFRCMACVASSWGCQWNTDDHTCSDMDETSGPNIIKHRQVSLWYQLYLWWYMLINVKQKFKNIYLISTFDAEPDCNKFRLKINKKLKSRYQPAPSCEANVGVWWISIKKSADVWDICPSRREGVLLIYLACSKC